ncbi:MAG: serine--tRNA ligase [Clostridiales bacterium]|jgi:seryl-tRNA synthetase|nr:serine--tRNA ligase [Clostridiales bacterium]
MLDIKWIAEHEEEARRALESRSGSYDISRALELDRSRRDIIKDVEALKARRNKNSEEVAKLKRLGGDASALILDTKEVGEAIKALDEALNAVESELKETLLSLPNIPDKTVPIGKTDADNREVRRVGTPPSFAFTPAPHWETGEKLGLFDTALAAKLSGARYALYKGDGARLERALYTFMLDTHTKRGYTEIMPPYVVTRETMTGTGQLPKFEEDAFKLTGDGGFLIPTAEVPVTNMLRGETLKSADLPQSYCAYTACFRAEAGSAGRDTRGLIRLHQFNKVELVKFTLPEASDAALETLTADAEEILKRLGLPYRVVSLCTGDLGFGSAKTYDIEVWMPSYGRYVEISSCSNYKDFQARRMSVKYKTPEGKSGLVHTLNGSGLAVGRTFAAILENCQNADGAVTLPEALVPYMGGRTGLG